MMEVDQKNIPFWDEHSLEPQRMYSILLMLYGSHPDKYERLVASAVPPNRMARAPRDFKEKQARWRKLLTPYLQPGAKTGAVIPSQKPGSRPAFFI